MNDLSNMPRRAQERPLSIAVVAMGGQGGGVLASWIVALAEAQGWHAQSTSVPGVAQRTGATLYYVEMLPPGAGAVRAPILSLMPAQGEVDVVLATELMEAGRSILRGLVTPDRSTLIASTHRLYAVAEKERPGDAIADPDAVVAAAGIAAKRVIAFDMETVARQHRSVISACMFGALAASKALPFAPESYEAVITAGGRSAGPSLAAFRAARDQAYLQTAPPVLARAGARFAPVPATAGRADLDSLLERIRAYPVELREMLFAGVRRTTDFQDPAYAGEYLDRVAAIHALDRAHGGANKAFRLTAAAAKYIAVAMSYDDVIRVAELKTRPQRDARVRDDNAVGNDEIVYTTEYMHPRLEEVAGTLPAMLGRFVEAHPAAFAWLFRSPRRVRSGTIAWFVMLYALSALKPIRRTTLRHRREMAHVEAWLALAHRHAATHYDLAVEIVNARRLIKGYSDTHVRGSSKFDRVLSAVPQLAARSDGADWLRRLRAAALMDEGGSALEGALKTIATL